MSMQFIPNLAHTWQLSFFLLSASEQPQFVRIVNVALSDNSFPKNCYKNYVEFSQKISIFFFRSANTEWQILSQLFICYFGLENFQSFFYVYEHNCVPYSIWVVSSIRVVFYNLP